MGYIIVTLHRRDDSNKMPLGSPILYEHMRDMMQTWVLFEGRICTVEWKYFCVKMKFPEESAFRMWYDAMIFLVHARHDGIFDVLPHYLSFRLSFTIIYIGGFSRFHFWANQ